MIFLPIVGRELRVAARRRSSYWTRTGLALGAIAVGVFLYLANVDAAPQFLARRIFLGLCALCMLFCLHAGRRSTADCLSQEKREGTFGLLFLTDLKGYDIVLGKLAAKSLTGFYGLLAIFPVLAVPILLGGVTSGEFWRGVLVLGDAFSFSLAVGIFASALTRKARSAMGANLLLLVVVLLLPGACGWLLAGCLPSHKFYYESLLSCPVYSLYLCDDSIFRWNKGIFWCSVGIVHALTWLLFFLACWIVPHSWQDKPKPTSEPARFSAQGAYRTRLLNRNPFYWLASRARYKQRLVWAVVGFLCFWWIWAQLQFGMIWLNPGVSGTNIAVMIMLNLALKLWVPVEACRPLGEARQSGAFELLLSTPLTVQDILHGQWLALRRLFLGPALLGCAAALGFLFLAVQNSNGDQSVLLTAWIAGLILFAADIAALGWASMYAALTTNNPNQAVVATVSRILLAPSVLLIAIIVLTSVYCSYSSEPPPSVRAYLPWWLGLGLGADLIWGLTARQRLVGNFRYLASPGSTTGKGSLQASVAATRQSAALSHRR
jgi:ABC-type transport system involved in multi-copper enzyme maturation permease subunit